MLKEGLSAAFKQFAAKSTMQTMRAWGIDVFISTKLDVQCTHFSHSRKADRLLGSRLSFAKAVDLLSTVGLLWRVLKECQMLPKIEQLLVLQDRDRQLHRTQTELARIAAERQFIQGRTSAAQTAHDAAKKKAIEIESGRKQLELEASAKQADIDRYAYQQLQTKKNDEYQALGRESEHCRKLIRDLEDRQIEFMESAEAQQKVTKSAQSDLEQAKKDLAKELTELDQRETNLKQSFDEISQLRAQNAGELDEMTRARYERLLKSKGPNAVAGVSHSVCGSCHMKLPPQVIVDCKHAKDINACPHCGCILYFTADMELTPVD